MSDHDKSVKLSKVLTLIAIFFLTAIVATIATEAFMKGKFDYFLLSEETQNDIDEWRLSIFCEPIILIGHPRDALFRVDDVSRTSWGVVELNGTVLVQTKEDTIYEDSDILEDTVIVHWSGTNGRTEVYRFQKMLPLVPPYPLRFPIVIGQVHGVDTYTGTWVFDPECLPRSEERTHDNDDLDKASEFSEQ